MEMMDFWCVFIIETMREAVKAVKVDFAYIWEDMCFKNGPFISPQLFRKFMLPHYEKLTAFLKKIKLKS